MRFTSLGGLEVKDGRLINDRPTGISGIAQATMINKSICRSRRVDEIADGIELAEGRKGFYRMYWFYLIDYVRGSDYPLFFVPNFNNPRNKLF